MRPDTKKLQRISEGKPAVAIVHSSDLIEEWLDHLELTVEDLVQRLLGSWIFGYAAALERAGVASILVFVTRRVRKPERVLHEPTGAVIWLLPPPRAFCWMHDRLAGRKGLTGALRQHVMPYLATPLRPLARALRADGCTAILCQEYECPRFDVLVLMGRVIGVPVFACFHGGDGRSGFEGLLHPITVRASAGVIISAEFEARRARARYRIPDAKLARIPNPVDRTAWRPEDRPGARARLGVPGEAVVAVWHGALYLPAKGLDVLADAWDRVVRARQGRDIRLMLVGGGADAGAFEQLVAARNLTGVTLPQGWVHDRRRLRDHLSAADVYVFSSRWEGYPNALLEAMACGLPVVATNIAGVPDIVGRDGAAGGVLVPPENAEAFADALGRLLDDADLRTELGRRAQARVDERFSLDVVGARIRDFFAERGMR